LNSADICSASCVVDYTQRQMYSQFLFVHWLMCIYVTGGKSTGKFGVLQGGKVLSNSDQKGQGTIIGKGF